MILFIRGIIRVYDFLCRGIDMRMKCFGLLLCASLWGSLVGCNDVKELTDDETIVIAEYAADLLLKYDLSYDDRLKDGEDKLERNAEREQEFPTKTLVTEEQTSDEATTKDTSQPQGKTEDATETVKEAADEFGGDIASLLNRSDISITYKDYVISKQYPATDEEGKFIYLDASEGYNLLVVRFKVTATTDQPASISLMNEKIDYKVLCNDSKAAKPMLTILMEDLGTLEATVQPGEDQEAVLVFQISETLKDSLNRVQLFINYNDKEHVIELQ